MAKVIDIAVGLACGRNGCPCGKTVQTGTGNTHCPAHEDKDPSLSVTEKTGMILVYCHTGCTQESVISVLRQRGLWPNAGSTPSNSAPSTGLEWPAHDAVTGQFVSLHVRVNKPNGKKSMFWQPAGVTVKDLALYRADVLTQKPGVHIVVCEGESGTDALSTIEEGLGIVAVGTVTGASTIPGDSALSVLVGGKVYLWPDNDEPGKTHMVKIASRLWELGCADVRMLNWSDGPPKGGDAADAIAQDVDIERLLVEAQIWKPHNVSLAELLASVCRVVRRYLVLTKPQLDAITLWVAHTHAFEAAECTPYISINSAEKQSGKTRLLDVLKYLTARQPHHYAGIGSEGIN